MRLKRLLLSVLVISYAFQLHANEIIMYKQNSSPKYFNSNSPHIGLCDRIYSELKMRLEKKGVNIAINPTLYPIKRILSKLEKGDGHIYCGAGKNAERLKKFIYLETPVYHVSNVVVVHKDDDIKLEKYDDLAQVDVVVGALHGTSSAKFIKKIKNIRLNDNFYDFTSAFKQIAKKRVRMFYYHDLGLNYQVKIHDLPLKVHPFKFRTIPQWMIISKNTPDDIQLKIKTSLGEMEKDGFLRKLWKDYF